MAAAAVSAFISRALTGRITDPVISHSTTTVTTTRIVSASGSVLLDRGALVGEVGG